MLRGLAIAVLLSLSAGLSSVRASDSPLIAAASGMQFALREIALSFEQDSGIEIRLTFGASGKLFRQVMNNAPFELFISADDSLVRKLEDNGRTSTPGVVIARGRLALFAAHDSDLKVDASLKGLSAALADNRLTRLAIANPAHAPYGRRAREALQHAGIWEQVQDRLVIGENVAQAAQFAASGAAQGGIVASALLAYEKIGNSGRHALLPESWHQPILHSMVALANSDESTMTFYRYLQSAKAQQILARHGFVPAF